MSHQPYYQQGYSPPPKNKGLPVWTLAILVFAVIFVIGMVIIIIAAANQKQTTAIISQPIAATAIPVPADCFNSNDLVFQNQAPVWNGIVHKEGTRLCLQGKIAKVDRNANPAELYFYPSSTNSSSNSDSFLAVKLTFEMSYATNPLDQLKDQTIRIKSFTDHNPRGWFIPIRDYDWFEVVSQPELKIQIKP